MTVAAFTQGYTLDEIRASAAMRSTRDLAIERAQPDLRRGSEPRRFVRTLAAICRPRMPQSKAA